MQGKLESHPILTRLLLPVDVHSQVVARSINNTTRMEHAGTPNNGVYFNSRTAVQQTPAYYQQRAGSQWPAAQNTSSSIYYMSLNTSQQNAFMQTGTPLPPNGLQVNCNQGNFYQDSQFLSSHPPQSSLQKPTADYLQQIVPAQWKTQGANQWKQYKILAPKRRMKDSHNGDTGRMAKHTLPSSPTTTSPPHQQRVNPGQRESSLTYNNQVVYNPFIGENNTQQATGYYHRPHSYITQSQQPNTDNHLNNMPVQQGTHVSCMGQRTQQHPAQLSPMFHSKEATMQSDKDKAISKTVDSLKSFYPVNQDVCSTANNSSLNGGVQSRSTTQPMPTSISNTRHSSVINPEKTSLECIPVISPTHDMAGLSQRSPYVPHNVLSVPMIDQNKSPGKELRDSQSPEAPPSATEDDCAVHSPGHTNSKAIAVVQPLFQQSSQVSSNHEAFDAVGDKSVAAGSPESSQEVSEEPVFEQELNSRLAGKTLANQHDAQMIPPSDVPRSQSCESGDDPEASISKSSSGPTVTWTIRELQKLIEIEETAQQKCSDLVDGINKLCQPFTKTFSTYEARKDLFYSLIECKRFVKKYVMPDTELTQLKPGVEKQRYHILRDNDFYTESPFRSTWLNINDQLDDIDKEFGFPPCLRCAHIQKMDSQADLVTEASKTPEHTDSEASEKDLKQVEPKPTMEKQVEPSPIRAASPSDTQDDPCYSFKIQVLPPEEAKLIYERAENPEEQTEVTRDKNQDSAHQPEKDACRSVVGEVADLSVAVLQEKDGLMDVVDITESDTDSVTEMIDVSRKSPCELIISEENKNDNPASTDDASLYPKIDSVYTCSDSESIQSMISAACHSKVENPTSTDIELSSLISEGEDKKLSDVSSDSSVETKEQTSVSTDSAPLPDVSLTGKRKKASNPETRAVLPVFKESSWCPPTTKAESQLSSGPEVSVALSVRKPLDSNSTAAQLVLFGSVQNGPGKTHKRKRHFSAEGAVCTSSQPPEVLSVPLRSMKRQFSEPLPVQEQSVKNKIFEIWRKSFPVKPLKRRGKNTQRSALSRSAQEKQPVSPEKKLKLLNSSVRTGDGSRCRMETKCISPGEV